MPEVCGLRFFTPKTAKPLPGGVGFAVLLAHFFADYEDCPLEACNYPRSDPPEPSELPEPDDLPELDDCPDAGLCGEIGPLPVPVLPAFE